MTARDTHDTLHAIMHDPDAYHSITLFRRSIEDREDALSRSNKPFYDVCRDEETRVFGAMDNQSDIRVVLKGLASQYLVSAAAARLHGSVRSTPLSDPQHLVKVR